MEKRIIVIKELENNVSVVEYMYQNDDYISKDGVSISTLDEECFLKLYVENNVQDLMYYLDTVFWLDNKLLNNITKSNKGVTVMDILKAKHVNK